MNLSNLKPIKIKHILIEDKSKLFTFPTSMENIETKFTKWDDKLIYKPIAIEKIGENLYRPLIETSSLLFLKQNGIKTINGIIIDGTELEIFIQSIIDTKHSRQLNIIEKAIILEKLSNQFKITEPENYLDLLGEEKSTKRMEQILKLNEIITPLKIFIAKEKLSLKLALAISYLKENEQNILFYIIDKLKLNKNKTKQTIEDIFSIEKKVYQNDSKEKILISLENIITDNQNKTREQLKNEIHNKLAVLKYPLYQKQIQLIEQAIKDLKLPPQCKVITPKNLEGEGIQVILKAKNLKEYSVAIDKLYLIKQDKQIDKLFQLLCDSPL